MLLWSFGPLALAIGTFIYGLAIGRGFFPKALPFVALVVVWISVTLSADGMNSAGCSMRSMNYGSWSGARNADFAIFRAHVVTGVPSVVVKKVVA